LANPIAKSLVQFFAAQNAIKEEDKEIYLYGIELIISISFTIASTFIITLMFTEWYYFFIFYLFFIPLRVNAGGYHTNTYKSCFFTTISVYCTYLILLHFSSYISIYIILAIILFSIYVVFKYAPIIHENNVITDRGIQLRKIYSRALISAYTFIILVLVAFYFNNKIVIAISLAIAIVTISMMANVIMERRKK
jgi:accessory gene regulator B